MKLHRLKIHNIASIEDAFIDFDSEPLASSEVFLITGKTGSGKSTILDAICLALYADTPRLRNTNMQGDTRDVDKDLRIRDPRQLMRRNTGEAFVELTFTGTNGTRYESTWAVSRARKKPSGNLQSKTWTLKNLDNGILLTKDKEIEKEISAAVGLDFNQFCRTTLLAQGEFTRFLNSDDKEKAAILEKITGVDIYTRIGQKVFAITSQKKKDLEDALRLVEGTTLLSAEESEQLRKDLADIVEQQSRLRSERELTEKKLEWLRTATALENSLAEARSNLAATEKETLDDDFKAKEELAGQWHDTIEQRGWMKVLLNSMADAEKQRTAIEESKEEYLCLKKEKESLADGIRKLEAQLAEADALLQKEKRNETALSNRAAIDALLQTITSHRERNTADTDAMKKEEESLRDVLFKRKSSADDAYAIAAERLTDAEKRLGENESALREAGLPSLRKEKERLQSVMSDADTAIRCLDSLDKERDRRHNKEKHLAELAESISALSTQHGKASLELRDAETEERVRRDALEKQKESASEWARAMRVRLKSGDECPVCGQKIESALPPESLVESLYRSLEKDWRKSLAKMQTLQKRNDALCAEIRTRSHLLAKERKEYESDSSISEYEKTAAEACKKCNIPELSETARIQLDSIKTECGELLTAVIKKIESAEYLEKKTAGEREATARLRSEADRARSERDKAANDMAESKRKIETYADITATRKLEISAAETEIKNLLGESLWTHDWRSETALFRIELEKTAREHESLLQRHTRTQQEIKEKSTSESMVSDVMSAIESMMPEWKEMDAADHQRQSGVKDPLRKANDLRTRLHSAIEQRDNSLVKAAEMDSLLAGYEASGRNLSRSRLAMLNEWSVADINAISSQLDNTKRELTARKTIVAELTRQIGEHLRQKPQLAEEEKEQYLSEHIRQINESYTLSGEKKGEINLRLRQDEENRRRQATLIKAAEEKKKEYARWSRLDQLIGDAQGTKFQRIAQSYVLSDLIHCANTYMRTLTDRYTLAVKPGSFVIMLEDAYQGFARRAASTISGGEGFLVSLALALALSDIGQSVSSDILFIDEGFGSLSGEPLRNAISTLRNLHRMAGRHVGIISHVDRLREQIPVQIRVEQDSNESSSRIRIEPSQPHYPDR